MSSFDTNVLQTLRVLHRIFRQLRDVEDRLRQGPRHVRAQEAALRQAEEKLAQLQGSARRLQVSIDEKQLTLKSREESIKKRRAQLMESKSNKEYQLLLEQIKADEMANSVLTDEILEEMERLDQLKADIAATMQEVAKAVRELEEAREQVAAAEPKLRAEIDGLNRERALYEEKLPPDFRETYERVVRSKAEDGLAPVDGQYCGGCHQQVPLNSINSLMLGQPITCRSCGRLLYLPENYSLR